MKQKYICFSLYIFLVLKKKQPTNPLYNVLRIFAIKIQCSITITKNHLYMWNKYLKIESYYFDLCVYIFKYLGKLQKRIFKVLCDFLLQLRNFDN